MCGIFGLLGEHDTEQMLKYFQKIKNRGPDSHTTMEWKNLLLGFHRLSIVDLSEDANQPLKHKDRDIWVICNGEIYNHKKILEELSISPPSNSDCESILYMYTTYGIEETVKRLDGVFAFILYDKDKDVVYVARDPFGVRPAFKGVDENKIVIASEMKAIPASYKIEHVPPGHYLTFNLKDTSTFQTTSYFSYVIPTTFNSSVMEEINKLLREAVVKRLMSDRPIGCLLSGGLDSSLIAAIAAENLSQPLHTFSIGMPNSPDLHYAKIVADHIKSTHHEVILSEQDFLDAIPEVIYAIESYDVTTVRASVGNYLIGKYIKENTDITVIFGGEGSDELCGGYLYFQNAPDSIAFDSECKRLLMDIHKYDALRCDRSISSQWSLEGRVPFLDKKFVTYFLSIMVSLRIGGHKELLRSAFRSDNLIPDVILERKKEAFSDGVSSVQNSWHTIIEKYLDNKIDTKDVPTGMTKEEFYYKKIFKEYYGSLNLDIIPYKWMPKWSNTKDPSARTL